MRLILVAVLLALAGCAGTDFVRPDTDAFRNGRTTYGEVIAKMGTPRREGSAIKNEKTVKSISYAYASVGGKPAGSYIHPLIKATTGEAAVYVFAETSGSFNPKFFGKSLVVTFDAAGVASEVEYSSSGNQ